MDVTFVIELFQEEDLKILRYLLENNTSRKGVLYKEMLTSNHLDREKWSETSLRNRFDKYLKKDDFKKARLLGLTDDEIRTLKRMR